MWTCLAESVETLTATPDGAAEACIRLLEWWAQVFDLVSLVGFVLACLGCIAWLLLRARLAILRRRQQGPHD